MSIFTLTYILSQVSQLKLNIGLYRDDGLAVSELGGRQTNLAKKKLSQVFKEKTFENDGKVVNYLDVTFDLEKDTYKPYMKPNHTPIYVHAESNHPPNILKNIPVSVNKRLCSISSSEEVFNSAVGPYQQALKNSGYNFELKFNPATPSEKVAKNRKRNVTYFNPPFSKNVRTNIGGKFLKLIDKCFPKQHPLRKIVNRNSVKISYKCMPNFKAEISRHNKKVMKNEEEPLPEPGCNCRDNPCPLPTKNCKTDHVIYRATLTDENQNVNTYTGLSANTFKKRYDGHKFSFKKREENSTTLSTHIYGT